MRPALWFQVRRVVSARKADAGTAGTIAALSGIGVLLVASGWGWWTLPGIAVIALGAAIVLAPQAILVGDDGVRLPGGAFVGWGTVDAISRSRDAVVVRVRGGEELSLVPRDAELAAELERRLAAWRAAEDLEPPSLLERGGRAPGEWIGSLRSLGPAGGGYRSPAVAPERLWDLLRAPRTAEGARIAALVALSAVVEDDSRSMIAEIASASASARVRAVADAVVAGADDASLARAVAG